MCFGIQLVGDDMGVAENLKGKRFDKLVVLELLDRPNKKGAYWLCKCDCGNEIEVSAAYLKRRQHNSCGCSNTAPNFIDITGQKFNMLTAIEKVDAEKWKSKWRCICDCGKETIVDSYELRSGGTMSCGCLRKIESPRRKDLAGKTFGRLTAICRDEEKSTKKITYWKCKCSCGKVVSVRLGNLQSGDTKSCGCLLGFDRKEPAHHGLSNSRVYKEWYGIKGNTIAERIRRGWSPKKALLTPVIK